MQEKQASHFITRTIFRRQQHLRKADEPAKKLKMKQKCEANKIRQRCEGPLEQQKMRRYVTATSEDIDVVIE